MKKGDKIGKTTIMTFRNINCEKKEEIRMVNFKWICGTILQYCQKIQILHYMREIHILDGQ